jgi:hypothetical protein
MRITRIRLSDKTSRLRPWHAAPKPLTVLHLSFARRRRPVSAAWVLSGILELAGQTMLTSSKAGAVHAELCPPSFSPTMIAMLCVASSDGLRPSLTATVRAAHHVA